MRFYKAFPILILLILAISATVVNAQGSAFETTDCPFPKPAKVTMDCGYLTVPEDYNNPEGKQIRLAVAIARNPSGHPEPDPIIYLEGGPGGSALELLNFSFDYQFASLFATNRDIILFDQRGIGYSEPALDCPELQKLKVDVLDYEYNGQSLTEDDINQLLTNAEITCGETLSASNNLLAYNSPFNAADVESLRVALGYDKVNLWGISYGTRLALTMMRDYPDSIRSVVIDSVYPLESKLATEQAQNAARAFDMLFDSCEKDTLCNETYPNLRQVYFDTVKQLNENPVSLNSINPFTGSVYRNILLTGDGFTNIVFELLYDTGSIPNLPQLVYQVSEGDLKLLSLLEGLLVSQDTRISYGMHYAMQCQEEFAFTTEKELDASWANSPYRALNDSVGIYQVCPAFGGTTPDFKQQAVVSDIPTLVTSGQYDPITPPSWAEHTANALSNSLYINFPNSGHGATATVDCPKSLIVDFFKNPVPDELDTSCVNDMKMTYTGTVETEVAFVPIDLSAYSIPADTIVPKDWKEQSIMPGMFAREETSLDISSLIFLRVPLIRDANLAANSLQSRMGVDKNAVHDYETNGITWKVFPIETQGVQGYLAITADKFGSILIIMTGDESLYDSVFIPVLDAFKFKDQ